MNRKSILKNISGDKIICCPKCHHKLSGNEILNCKKCSSTYPYIDGVPILISENDSTLKVKEIKRQWNKLKNRQDILTNKIFRFINQITPTLYSIGRHKQIARKFVNEIKKIKGKIIVLSIGNGTGGIVFEQLKKLDNVTLVETDIFISSGRQFVSDIHALPIASKSVDVILVEGVLEHVINPDRAVSEIRRALKDRGLLLCTLPFVLGVHTHTADYQRYSRLGLISLLRYFELIECEPVEGAFTALAYQLSYANIIVATSIFKGKLGEIAFTVAKYFGNYFIFWLKYLDPLMRGNPVSKDSAINYYYIGKKAKYALTDKRINLLFDGKGICPK